MATWEIKDDRLFVIAFGGTVEALSDGERDIGMREVYGTEKPVWAEWVSKTFAIPVGQEIPDPEGFRSPTWSAYCDVEVVNGRVVGMTERPGAKRTAS
ncbi:hypothetical protein FF100_00475 [Methylobacterium terricola]|uniref:Uncharacterized protein n=1 Tax=Methylobacterium terricola TaxID=2583531 RepID=A0A5C4LPP9_9HYPH|nr:hypothetical protein [Methylobacterium terricola]TNC15785.1 hypothetical protein FF100_00475 [Methylobacterium terricola]